MKTFKQFINEYTSATTTYNVTYKGETVKVKAASQYQARLVAAEDFGLDKKDKSIHDKMEVSRA